MLQDVRRHGRRALHNIKPCFCTEYVSHVYYAHQVICFNNHNMSHVLLYLSVSGE
jgi:hypothetical protein